MKYLQTALFLVLWHVACTAALMLTLHSMGTNDKWPLAVLVLLELGLVAYLSLWENFINRCLGRVITFLLLLGLLWGSLFSLFYASMFIFGETL